MTEMTVTPSAIEMIAFNAGFKAGAETKGSMIVFVVVEHFDRGSDEVNVQGVYSTQDKAFEVILQDFPGYTILPEDDLDGSFFDTWYYADGDEDQDRVMVVQKEVK